MSRSPITDPNPLFVWVGGAARQLVEIGAGNPRLEAEYLMAAALGIPRIRLWLIDQAPTPEQIVCFEALLARRLAREPLQYVLGTAEFAGLTLEVGPGVFIPRSETEVLVERVEALLHVRHGGRPASPLIVDVGTGSGAVLLALLDRMPGALGIGTERARTALAYARRNAIRLGLANRVGWVCGDLLEPIACTTPIDAIVSNPPYVRLAEAQALAPEIREHEPPESLLAGADGLDVIRRLVPQAAGRLRPAGLLALEIGITQGEAVRALLSPEDWRGVEIRPDLTGRPRVLLAVRA